MFPLFSCRDINPLFTLSSRCCRKKFYKNGMTSERYKYFHPVKACWLYITQRRVIHLESGPVGARRVLHSLVFKWKRCYGWRSLLHSEWLDNDVLIICFDLTWWTVSLLYCGWCCRIQAATLSTFGRCFWYWRNKSIINNRTFWILGIENTRGSRTVCV